MDSYSCGIVTQCKDLIRFDNNSNGEIDEADRPEVLLEEDAKPEDSKVGNDDDRKLA